jgi:hypothetical protein
MVEMETSIGRRTADVITQDASGAQFRYKFSRQGDELELQERLKARPAEGEIPSWNRVTPKVTPKVRDELQSRGYSVVD